MPGVHPWVSQAGGCPREAAGSPYAGPGLTLLPADAAFPAPARDMPAAHRPPGVWHSRAGTVSCQQARPGPADGCHCAPGGLRLHPSTDQPHGGPGAVGRRAGVCVWLSSRVHAHGCAHVGLHAGCTSCGEAEGVCKGPPRVPGPGGCWCRCCGRDVGVRRAHGCAGSAALWVFPGAPPPTRPHPLAVHGGGISGGPRPVLLAHTAQVTHHGCATPLTANICPSPMAEAPLGVC